MHHPAILGPMFALAAWTVAILLLMVSLRVASKVKPSDFALGESDRVPLRPRLAHRNYVNLLELPVLFYVVGALVYASGVSPGTLVPLAWTYFGLRILHSLIHIGYTTSRSGPLFLPRAISYLW